MGPKIIVFTALFTIIQCLYFAEVSADFCEWGICHPTEQYCCGNNICCNYFNYNTWYLWGGAIMIGLLLVILYYILCSPVCVRMPDPESDKVPIVIR